MKLEQEEIKKLKAMLKPVFKKHLGPMPYHAFFFGSRVIGSHHERSDIDIGIDAGKPLPFSTIEAIKEEITELPVLYSIDVVDIRRTPEEFRQVALQQTEPII